MTYFDLYCICWLTFLASKSKLRKLTFGFVFLLGNLRYNKYDTNAKLEFCHYTLFIAGLFDSKKSWSQLMKTSQSSLLCNVSCHTVAHFLPSPAPLPLITLLLPLTLKFPLLSTTSYRTYALLHALCMQEIKAKKFTRSNEIQLKPSMHF